MKKLSKIIALVMCLITLMSACSFMFISAYAVDAPKFAFEEASKSGNTVTYELKLKSGGFNSLDCTFAVSSGVTCTAIKFADGVSGVSNPKTCKISYANTDTYSTSGTFATATFTVPSGNYSIVLNVDNCAISNNGSTPVDVTSSVAIEGASQSWFARLIAAIVSFFQMIINFFKSLFA